MIEFILGIIILYIVFRLLTTLIIPKITQKKIEKYKQEILKDREQRYFDNNQKADYKDIKRINDKFKQE